MIEHSPSDCLLTADRETRDFCIRAPPLCKSSSLSLAFGKFCAISCEFVMLCLLEALLTSCAPVPPLCILNIGSDPDSHFREISHSIFGFCQPSMSSFACPEISLSITLLQDAFRSRQVPSTQSKLALVLFLNSRLAVPGYTLSSINRATDETIFVSGT